MPDFSGLIEHFPYLGLFILLILGGMGLPFPEGASLILCGFLISTHGVNLLPAVVVAYAGILTGDLLCYLLGRKFGGRLIGEIFLAAGILKMPFARLLIVDAISALLAIVLWSGIGYIGGKSLKVIQEDITRIEHLVILIIIVLIVIWLFVRYFRSREDRNRF